MKPYAIILFAVAVTSCATDIPVRCTWDADNTCVSCVQHISTLKYYFCRVCSAESAETTECGIVDENIIVDRRVCTEAIGHG